MHGLAVLFIGAFFLWAAPAQALQWQLDAGSSQGERGHGAGHGGQPHSVEDDEGASAPRMRRGRVPVLNETEGVSVRLYLPDAQALELDGNRPRLPVTAPGYYQALVALRAREDGEDSAIHYLKLRGQGGPDLRGWFSLRPENRLSPSEVTDVRKSRLEIVPDPLPREKRVYHEGMRADFILRFDGKPLAERFVALRTANGSELMAQSDQQGRVRFTLPMDFEEVLPTRRGTPPVEMVLRAVHRADDEHFTTSLTMPYSPHPSHWQSSVWAVGLLMAGMIGGGLLGRRVSALAPPTRTRKPGGKKENKA